MKIPLNILKVLQDDKMAPVIGNPDAENVIYEFFDYNCGHCKNQYFVLEDLISKNKNVKIILENFPIFPISQIPAMATIASKNQGKAFLLNKALFENNLLPANYSNFSMEELNKKVLEKVFKIAEKTGINLELLRKDIISKDIENEIQKIRNLAHSLNIHGTPALIINGELYPTFMKLDEIKKLL